MIIECGAEASPLGASLATLVPGAIEGLVREVVVVDCGLDTAARKVADHAGCRIAGAGALPELLAGAKGDWLMLLEPGARLAPEWVEAIATHLGDVAAGAMPRAARFAPPRQGARAFAAQLFRRPGALRLGLLLPKTEALARLRPGRALADLAKGVAATRLAATIRPRPH
ncbi:glycosyl transferase family 2 [Aureimonas endophytica]|uniref:Glycosyl transferase family 2 n=1 Tax=Aureimonas endophytica TaxID=2027858 RepID=A0A916ZUG8_9HYPH|nr:glycosyl transferase family 2 [Aureimonas endophytica]